MGASLWACCPTRDRKNIWATRPCEYHQKTERELSSTRSTQAGMVPLRTGTIRALWWCRDASGVDTPGLCRLLFVPKRVSIPARANLQMKPLSECRLYSFVDTAYLNGRDVASVAQQLCDGGSDVIQLRAKGSSPDEICRMAEKILPITNRAGVPLVINDFPEIAMRLGAAYCHLGQEDFEMWNAERGTRNEIPKLRTAHFALRIGLSTHAPAQAESAMAAGPDYIAIGPIYATGTKPTAKPVTLEYVRWATANVHIPWFAIGGINLETLDEVLAAGAKRICVVSAILNAPDIAKACRELRDRLE